MYFLDHYRTRISQVIGILFLFLFMFSQKELDVTAPYVSGILFLVGCLCVGAAMVGRMWCAQYIAGYKNDVLVREGPYSVCRNPLYFFSFLGGIGVGRVTRPGLACAVGDWAINPVPRRMITEALQAACRQCGYTGGLRLTLSIPEGQRLAQKTFNPRLGIVGGLSILGTSGIVDPMSEQALVDTIHTEMDSRRAAGQTHLLAFFGNYGVDFSRDHLGVDVSQRVTISNYVGETLDYAAYKGFSDVLVIGHIGKLVKVAQGIMNTHSHYADGRTTLLALEAVFAGASRQLARQIYDSLTTDEAVRLLKEQNLLEPVMAAVCEKIEAYMDQRTHGEVPTAAVVFSNAYGVLGLTSRAKEFLALHTKGELR